MDGEHLVILIHGIRTRALWMDEVKPALEDSGFTVSPTSYGQFGIFRFLMPFAWLRRKAIERVVTDILTARRVSVRQSGEEPKGMSVIAHSFGTYVLTRIMADHPELQWKRVILCGSVVREDFPLHQYLDRFEAPILNEIGTRDYWPALAESFGWGYGSVGSTGFNRPPVVSRWHQGFTHSQFLTKEFCQSQWVPFLRDGRIDRGDPPRGLPFGIRILTALPLRWFVPTILALFIGFVTIIYNLPFRYEGEPKSLLPNSFDVPATTGEEPKLQSFTFLPNTTPEQFSVPSRWARKSEAGYDYWLADYADSRSPMRFDILRRIMTDDKCIGTVVAMQEVQTNQIFIPDIEDRCQNHELLSRQTNFGLWQNLGPINFGK